MLNVYLLQPTWVAAASLQDMLTADKTPACTCQDDVQKRLAHASAIARQHIALGLAPQHTRALRVLPTCATQRKVGKSVHSSTQQLHRYMQYTVLLLGSRRLLDTLGVIGRRQMLQWTSRLRTWLSYCRSRLVKSLLNRSGYILHLPSCMSCGLSPGNRILVLSYTHNNLHI